MESCKKFASNEIAEKLLKIEIGDKLANLGDVYVQTTNQLKSLDENFRQVNDLIKDPKNFIFEKISALKRDVDLRKEKLKDIYNRPEIQGQEKLFTFDTTITSGDKSVNVEVIITNPTVDDIQKFFDEGIKQLDQVLPHHFEGDNGFKRIVFEYKADSLEVKFAVLKNGVPVQP
jgi:hypothetical protein